MAAAAEKQPEIDFGKTKMTYNRLGNSGLKVSALSFGSWTTFAATSEEDDKLAYDCMTTALKLGVNFFDNAEAYAGGKSEKVMGRVLQRWFKEGLCLRSDVVISTKIFWGSRMAGIANNPNAMGLSHKHIIEGVNASLARLQLDYVDLIFCHRPDAQTPIVETVRAMTQVVNQGKAFYWGTSEWSAQEITEAHAAAEKWNLIPPTMEQPQYNLFCRKRVEVEYFPLYVTRGLGTTIWSPLASGLLTGKYSGGNVPADSRLAQEHNSYIKDHILTAAGLDLKDITAVLDRVDKLKAISDKLECTQAQLSIAWCLKFPHISTVITGASKVSQVEENMKALEVVPKLTPEILKEIEDIFQTKPAPLTREMGRGVARSGIPQ